MMTTTPSLRSSFIKYLDSLTSDQYITVFKELIKTDNYIIQYNVTDSLVKHLMRDYSLLQYVDFIKDREIFAYAVAERDPDFAIANFASDLIKIPMKGLLNVLDISNLTHLKFMIENNILKIVPEIVNIILRKDNNLIPLFEYLRDTLSCEYLVKMINDVKNPLSYVIVLRDVCGIDIISSLLKIYANDDTFDKISEDV